MEQFALDFLPSSAYVEFNKQVWTIIVSEVSQEIVS